MTHRRAILKVVAGPNQGDTVSIDYESCRLIGRHLSENETIFIDRDGNRGLDSAAMGILTEHFRARASDAQEEEEAEDIAFDVSTFDRGPDVILADDSISRAHAMIFFDSAGVGVIDLASTNGTLVNQDRVTSGLLRENDVISLGNSQMVVGFSA